MVTKNIHTYYKTTTTTKLMFSKLYIFNSLIFFFKLQGASGCDVGELRSCITYQGGTISCTF